MHRSSLGHLSVLLMLLSARARAAEVPTELHGKVTVVSGSDRQLCEVRFPNSVKCENGAKLRVLRGGGTVWNEVGTLDVVAVSGKKVAGRCVGFTPREGDVVEPQPAPNRPTKHRTEKPVRRTRDIPSSSDAKAGQALETPERNSPAVSPTRNGAANAENPPRPRTAEIDYPMNYGGLFVRGVSTFTFTVAIERIDEAEGKAFVRLENIRRYWTAISNGGSSGPRETDIVAMPFTDVRGVILSSPLTKAIFTRASSPASAIGRSNRTSGTQRTARDDPPPSFL